MSEVLTLPYDDLVRRVIAHHRDNGELVDFWLIKRVAIVGSYRVRKTADEPWKDLLPTGVSAERYQRVIQRLAPVLFPDEEVTIKSIEREVDTATITFEQSAAQTTDVVERPGVSY